MKKDKIYFGDIYIIDLVKDNGCCLSGRHHCVVIKRFGATLQVVPISTNRGNLHYGELPYEVEKNNKKKQLKFKVGQLTTVSVDRVGSFVQRADRQMLIAIKDFIQLEIVDFITKRAA